MLLSLTIIALVAAGLLAGVYMLTQQNIERQKQAAVEAARAAVLNGHEGTAIEVETNGFGGVIRLMVGFDAEGTILGYEVLEQQETPGLGTHIVEWFKDESKPGQNIVGRRATGKFQVSKDGGDVDAITAATISSRAFLKAVNEAYDQLGLEPAEAVEATSGATSVEATSGASVVDDNENENEDGNGKEADHE